MVLAQVKGNRSMKQNWSLEADSPVQFMVALYVMKTQK